MKGEMTMKHKTLSIILVVLALLMSACGPAAVTEAPAQETEPTATSAPPTEEEAAATETQEVSPTSTSAATDTPSVTETTEASIPVTGGTEVRATLNDTYGPILVDGDGNALYIFTRDTQNGDSSACTDEECITEWPPLTTEEEPTAGAGAIQNLLGTITREDGTQQVTYNGWPLYLFAGGGTSGHGAEGEWFLVNPSGRAVEE
jgi:predicted lipoprotein with Yx(FWY)xxD motif